METIVFIGTYKTGPSREAQEIVKKLGYYIVLFTNRRRYFNQQEDFPEVDQMLLTNFNDIQNLRAKIRDL